MNQHVARKRFQPLLTHWNGAPGNCVGNIHWAEFESIEITPVALMRYETGEEAIPVPDEPDNATVWTLYGRRPDGTVECLHDAPTRFDALSRAADVSAHTGLPIRVTATEGMSRFRQDLLRPFLDLSTAHISEATASWIALGGNAHVKEEGFLVWVPSRDHDFESDDMPGDLKCILQAAQGFADYVLFDRDADTDERFAVYDW